MSNDPTEKRDRNDGDDNSGREFERLIDRMYGREDDEEDSRQKDED